MTIDHRAEALSLLQASREDKNTTYEGHNPEADRLIAEAQVHAALARNEEQAARTADLREALNSIRRREYDARSLVAAHIAQGLTSRDKDRWKAARDLAQALDETHNNLDDLIDARLSDDGYDTKTPWSAPAGSGGGWIAHTAEKTTERDPWAPTPDITDQIPEPVRRVIAGHLAEALIDGRDSEIQKWVRGITYELKREGVDLTEAIKARITDLTLGRDPFEPPF
ncbi:hypothetical protein ACF061_01080 [Streptomyces sp. NPDC015220]|uniref:hypothetical protein n=1 Tax=Streptomyces sp. NPDC015220 TaxID=3364947 RepID=UPI0036F4DA67